MKMQNYTSVSNATGDILLVSIMLNNCLLLVLGSLAIFMESKDLNCLYLRIVQCGADT